MLNQADKIVWLLNHYAVEPEGTGGTRHYQLARFLAKYNWKMIIIAASVEHKTGRQRLSPGMTSELQYFQSVPFQWIRTPNYKGNGWGRVLSMFSYTIRVLLPKHTSNLPKPDVIVGSSVHPFAALAGALLARRYRVPFVVEIRDLWPQTLVDLGRLSERSVVVKLMRKLEYWLYREAKRIIVLGPQAGKYMEGIGLEPDKTVWIPNGVDIDLFEARCVTPNCESGFTLMYFGAMGQANALEPVIEAMALVKKRRATGSRIFLRLIGDGPEKASLQKRVHLSGLDEMVFFENSIQKSKIPSLAAQADAFIISVLDKPDLYKYGISMNKLFEYMAAGKPVILASEASNDPVADACCGISVRPGDIGALADAIEKVADMTNLERLRLGKNGRSHAEEYYSFNTLANRFADTLNSVL